MSVNFRVRVGKPGMRDQCIPDLTNRIFGSKTNAMVAAKHKAFQLARHTGGWEREAAYVQEYEIQDISHWTSQNVPVYEETKYFGVFRRGWFGDKLVTRVWVEKVEVV